MLSRGYTTRAMGRRSRQRAQLQTTDKIVTPPHAVHETALPPANRKLLLVACALLLVAITIVFAQVRSQDFINFDDPPYVTENTTVRQGFTDGTLRWAFTSFHGSNWHPLTSLAHVLDVELFGIDAGAHKIVNVVLHAAAALLLLLFLVRTTGEVWPSAIVAALFALHPTRVESVVWVSERKDVLSAFFWMLTLFLYAGWYQTGRKPLRMVAIALACAGALLAKPAAVTLPFVLLLLDYWPLARRDWRRMILEKIPLFALVLIDVLMTLRAQTAAIGTVSFAGRVANTLLSYVEYLRLLVWPSKLAVFYPYRTSIQSIDVILAAILLVVITAAVVWLARRAPYVAVGWLWFLGTLVPMAGVVQVGRQSMADRYTYISYVGLFIAIVWSIRALALRRPALVKPVVVAAGAVIVALGAATYVQAGYWKNSETLFGRALQVTKPNGTVHLNYASALLERGAADDAVPHLRTALTLEPGNALAYSGLGNALVSLGDDAGAEHALRQAIKLDPWLSAAYRGLAQIEMKRGRSSAAIELLEKASRNPGDADPAVAADLAAMKGDITGALPYYAEAVEQRPKDAILRTNYGAMLTRMGREQDALAQYEEALRLSPGYYEVHMNLGALLSRLERPEATTHFQNAARIRPKSPEPHIYLSLVYANAKDPRAIAEVEAAANIDPVAANSIFTNAVRIPFKDSNLSDFRAALKAQAGVK